MNVSSNTTILNVFLFRQIPLDGLISCAVIVVIMFSM